MFDCTTNKVLISSVIAGTALIVIIQKCLRPKKPALCKNNETLEGKTVIITGANTGIGLATAKELARRKARVIFACRNIERGEQAVESIKKDLNLQAGANLVVKKLDLSSFSLIRDFVEEIKKTEKSVHILINNAAVLWCPFSLTNDGLAMTFGVNHVGHFLLTNLLLDKLIDSAPSRVIIVASKLYERASIDFSNLNVEGCSEFKSYAQSKLANILFAHELSKRLPIGTTVNSLHPGMVATDLPRHKLNSTLRRVLYMIFGFLFMRSPYEGAQTVVHLATAPELEGVSGKYFGDCKIEDLKPNATDSETAKKLWEVSEKMCGLK